MAKRNFARRFSRAELNFAGKNSMARPPQSMGSMFSGAGLRRNKMKDDANPDKNGTLTKSILHVFITTETFPRLFSVTLTSLHVQVGTLNKVI